jgi:hypothetical protein
VDRPETDGAVLRDGLDASQGAGFRVRFRRSYNIGDHVLPSVFGTRQINDVVICVLAIADLKIKSWHLQKFRTVRPICLFGCGHALIKCNADPACLPPNDVTVVIAVLDVDHEIE